MTFRKIRKHISETHHYVFIESETVSMELLSGLTTIAASYTEIAQGNNVKFLFVVLITSIVISVIQSISAFPLNHPRLRHYSNIASTWICVIISYTIFKTEGFNSGVGGYLGLATMALFCSFRTRILINDRKNGR